MYKIKKMPRILIIAGSDSGGGAGIQADVKTITCLGGYAMTAITALTAQNTCGVFGIHEVPIDFLRLQIEKVLEDIGADYFKTGMLHSAEIINLVAEILANNPHPLVLDPVMQAKGGSALLNPSALGALTKNLLPHASLLTPNLPEAALLTGMEVTNLEEQIKAGKILRNMGAQAVLVKGGHGEGKIIYDVLVDAKGEEIYESTRIHTQHTHGTGCTLASAISCFAAKGEPMREAVRLARDYLRKAIISAPRFGKGHGPLNHFCV